MKVGTHRVRPFYLQIYELTNLFASRINLKLETLKLETRTAQPETRN